jgi:hypothetical protein
LREALWSAQVLLRFGFWLKNDMASTNLKAAEGRRSPKSLTAQELLN